MNWMHLQALILVRWAPCPLPEEVWELWGGPHGEGPPTEDISGGPWRTEAWTSSAKYCHEERDLREALYDFFSSEFQILGVQSSSLYIWLIIQKLKAKPEHYRVRWRQHVCGLNWLLCLGTHWLGEENYLPDTSFLVATKLSAGSLI